ncbi:MAG: hypothetical protein KKA79_07725 [Nanoarchaeota archaeon]|nr:hypothetical protein [Nanoarchaeota archaeon]MCG2718793.1 hypothetical protein [Nanoarchaeota archaeon]
MRILFAVTGVGYGDATREHANIEAFLKKDPNTKIMVAGYDNSLKYFKPKFPTIEIRGYKFTEQTMKFSAMKFALSNYPLPFKWTADAIKLKKQVKEFNPDIIISDFEPVGMILSRLLKKKGVFVFAYDPQAYKICPYKNPKTNLQAKYFNTLYKSANAVIIPKLLGRKKETYKKKYHYVNPIIRTKPSELPPKDELMESLGLEREPIMVMLGGSKFGNILANKIMHFAHLFNEDFIIFGSQIEKKYRKNVKYYPFKKNVLEYMKVSKGVITLGGHLTLSETLAFKKPAMIFPIADHVEQILNAYTLEGVSHVRYNLKDLRKHIKTFLRNLDPLKKRIPKIEFNGSEQIVDIVYNMLKK